MQTDCPCGRRRGTFFHWMLAHFLRSKQFFCLAFFEKIIRWIWRLILGQAVPEKKESIKPSIFVKIIDSEKKSYYDISE